MSTDALPGRASAVTAGLAAGRLGVPAVVFFVLGAAAPWTVVAGVVTTGFAVTGLTALPVAFPVVAAVLAVFTVGYVAMARRISNAGAFSAYVAHGLGKPAGVAAAMVALGAYGCFAMAGFGGFGAAAGGFAEARLGWQVPWWTWAGAAWAAVSVLGVLRVSLSGRLLGVLLVAEVSAIVVFDAAGLAHPADSTITFTTLSPAGLAAGGAGAAVVLAVTGFVGFEASAVFSEETKNPRRTVARATYTALGLITCLYALSAWAMTLAAGPDHIVATAREHGTDTVFVLAAPHLNPLIVDAGRALFATSLFAAQLAFWNFTTRYAFAAAREGVLPARLGTTSTRGHAPAAASLTLSVAGLAVIVGYAATGTDPLVHLFYAGAALGGFGVLVLLAATSWAVVGYFARHAHTENTWTARTAPALAAVALTSMVALALAHFHTLLGVDPHSPLRWVLPAGFAALAVVGAVWALILRTTRPDVYARIGLGPQAATGRTTSLAATLERLT